MSILKQVIRQWCNKTSVKAIVRNTGLSRNTVRSYIRRIRQQGLCCDQLLKLKDEELEVFFNKPSVEDNRLKYLQKKIPGYLKELERTGVNRWVIWNEYKVENPDGYQYSRFCYHLQQYLKTKQATLHIEQLPGDKLYVDFTGKKLSWVDKTTGEVHPAEVFVATLGHSQLAYVEAIGSQKQGEFLQAIDNALQSFGGVPGAIVPDNLKSAVIKADKYEPRLNEALSDLANHYNTSIFPARSRKPRDKAWVENTIRTVYSRVFAPLRDRVFFSLEELNLAIQQQVDSHNNQPFQGTQITRQQRFDEHEKSKLLSLPVNRFEIKKVRYMTVMKNCHVRLNEDKHYYSAPYRFIGQKVKVISTQKHVSLWYKGERIALHKRNLRPYTYSTISEHMPSHHRFVSEWNEERFLRWAAAIAPEVHDFIKSVLDTKPYPEQAYRSCTGILSFEKKVGKQRLLAACNRAAFFRAYNYKAIQGILNNGLEKQQPVDVQLKLNLPDHDNIRGPECYQ